MKDLILRPRAEVDVGDAASWYEDQRAGLGIRFLDVLGRAQLNPFQFPEADPGVRRGLLGKFPYSVYFTVGATSLEVIAVLHQHRHPDTLKGRK
jgi:plasmid stabilization system protein ParE